MLVGILQAEWSLLLETIVEQLRGIQVILDIIREHCCEDKNELVAYMNNIQFNLNKTLEQLESIQCNQTHLNDRLCNLEAQVEHIYFRMHEQEDFPTIPPELHLFPFPSLLLSLPSSLSSILCVPLSPTSFSITSITSPFNFTCPTLSPFQRSSLTLQLGFT